MKLPRSSPLYPTCRLLISFGLRPFLELRDSDTVSHGMEYHKVGGERHQDWSHHKQQIQAEDLCKKCDRGFHAFFSLLCRSFRSEDATTYAVDIADLGRGSRDSDGHVYRPHPGNKRKDMHNLIGTEVRTPGVC